MIKDSLPTDLEKCEDEPIQRPGVVQPHGVMLVLSGEEFLIKNVSENAGDIFAMTPEEMIGSSVIDVLAEENRESLVEAIDWKLPSHTVPLRVTVKAKDGPKDYDGSVHLSGDDLILELENGRGIEKRSNAVDRSVKHHFDLTARTLRLISRSQSNEEAAEVVCQELKAFTGYDRVMLYQFSEEGHGHVVAEAREQNLEPFLGLRYPASDIPKNARELYVRNFIRSIPDVNAQPVSLLPEHPNLDMSDCSLRAVSPFHIRYLQNMGVAASMSISLIEDGKLWGLIACHHYDGPHHLSATMRVSCVHFGLVVSAQLKIAARSFAATNLARRKARMSDLIRAFSTGEKVGETISMKQKEFLDLFCVDGLVFWNGEDWHREGATPSDEICEAIRGQVFQGRVQSLVAFESLSSVLSGIDLTDCPVCGMMGIWCSEDWLLLFFRKEFVYEVRWGGDPRGTKDATGVLTPRNSFREWKETVSGKCRPWSEQDHEIADELQTILAGYVLRQRAHLERLNHELESRSKEIEQFAYTVSHDLKSPLVTITGWIDATKEDLESGDLDEVRFALSRIEGAASRMGNLIEDLLDFSRIGRVTGKREHVDLSDLMERLKQDYTFQLSDCGAELVINEPLGQIYGYPIEIQRAIENLVSNAIRHGCPKPGAKIMVNSRKVVGGRKVSVTDSGGGIAPEHHERIFELFNRLDPRTEGTGVGLASVAKVAQLHRGDCGVESVPGEGATFWIRFGNWSDK